MLSALCVASTEHGESFKAEIQLAADECSASSEQLSCSTVDSVTETVAFPLKQTQDSCGSDCKRYQGQWTYTVKINKSYNARVIATKTVRHGHASVSLLLEMEELGSGYVRSTQSAASLQALNSMLLVKRPYNLAHGEPFEIPSLIVIPKDQPGISPDQYKDEVEASLRRPYR